MSRGAPSDDVDHTFGVFLVIRPSSARPVFDGSPLEARAVGIKSPPFE
jgi:hypothetical protein